MTSEGPSKEAKRFNYYVKCLRKLQKDTNETIENVEKSIELTPEQIVELRFTLEEIKDLQQILNVPTCFIVTGQDVYGQMIILTRLLEEQTIPIVQLCQREPSLPWRPMKVIHSSDASYGIITPENAESESYINLYSSCATIKSCESIKTFHAEMSEQDILDERRSKSYIQIGLDHPLLKNECLIVACPVCPYPLSSQRRHLSVTNFLENLIPKVFPILLYAITSDEFTRKDVKILKEIKRSHPDLNILFISVPKLPSTFGSDLPESEQHDVLVNLGVMPPSLARGSLQRSKSDGSDSSEEDAIRGFYSTPKKRPSDRRKVGTPYPLPQGIQKVLCDNLGLLKKLRPPDALHHRWVDGRIRIYNDYISDLHNFDEIIDYLQPVFNGQLVKAASLLHEGHMRCMRMIILNAFDMAREIQITPRRIQYAKEKEAELFDALLTIASKKQDEIQVDIMDCLNDMQSDLAEQAANHEFTTLGSESVENAEDLTIKDLQCCTEEIQDLVVTAANEAFGRILASRVDVMRDSYLGTLHRCLSNLEKDSGAGDESPRIVNALRQMMNVAYQVEVTVYSSSSVLRSFWKKMKHLMTTMPGRATPVVDANWKRKIAMETVNSLIDTNISKTLCSQLKDRLKLNHDTFLVCMKQLESQLASHLEQTEEQQMRIKKVDAPRLARMSLEATSLADEMLFGMPRLGRELGRGQYGVVYGCKSWGDRSPCAVKSLVPLDEKHWNDLAMEFYYTRSVPHHDRIVALRGSVIDHWYAQGEAQAVLLIMDKYSRDLYSGIKSGLEWFQRLQIALDVTQGIRFLHSQGLVHRDIKLKNVLLDKENRAKLTDLGFCKPEAMMSGSIVGTPIHMAPELFTGHYDNAVDVYAFGILFWYICAGHVRLPQMFEQCQSRDQLWNYVRKGVRPERLSQFSDECWRLMNHCWEGDPTQRPFLGNVEPRLTKIMDRLTNLSDESDAISKRIPAAASQNVPIIKPIKLRKGCSFSLPGGSGLPPAVTSLSKSVPGPVVLEHPPPIEVKGIEVAYDHPEAHNDIEWAEEVLTLHSN